ncbi:MAG: hypothetical protein A2020_06545 [Lentisphaerae bacterium GWF2_45_14]|nr:MAG: hypothetical protein A2020_06545 [Lentisphaerae bacterium GWF2_45_14]
MGYFDDIIFITVSEIKDFHEPANGTIHGHESYSLEYVYKGGMRFTTGGRNVILQAPAVYWMKKGNFYRYEALPGTARSQIWSNFTGPRAEKITAGLYEDIPSGCVNVHKPAEFYERFREMLKLYREDSPGNHYKMVILLESLVGLTIEASRMESIASPCSGSINKIAGRVRKEPLKNWDFKLEAEKNAMSYSSFRKQFKKLQGVPPYEFQLQCKILYAARVMGSRNISVKETAEFCGFTDISSFSRLFKKKMGISPGSYPRPKYGSPHEDSVIEPLNFS